LINFFGFWNKAPRALKIIIIIIIAPITDHRSATLMKNDFDLPGNKNKNYNNF